MSVRSISFDFGVRRNNSAPIESSAQIAVIPIMIMVNFPLFILLEWKINIPSGKPVNLITCKREM